MVCFSVFLNVRTPVVHVVMWHIKSTHKIELNSSDDFAVISASPGQYMCQLIELYITQGTCRSKANFF